MIDFRYHLVSLMSVFLALAVGIALGAGPLKETIGDTLTGQVDQLRAEKEDLRDQLASRTTELSAADAAFSAVTPALLDGVLSERRVALVEVADVDPAVLEEVVARLTEAGATITATVQVTDAWTDPEQHTFRQTLAGTLVDYLDPVPAEDAGTGTELAEALAQALTVAVPADPDTLAETSGVILQLLSESALISYEGDVTVPADAVVVLAGPTVGIEEVEDAALATASEAPEEAEAGQEQLDAQLGAALQIGLAVQARSTGAVVAGGVLGEDTLISRVRQDETAVTRLSTVESVHTLTGQVSVPLALSARIAGTVGHFGPSESASAPMPPRVVLPPVERVATVPDVVPPVDGSTDAGAVDPGATPEVSPAPPGEG